MFRPNHQTRPSADNLRQTAASGVGHHCGGDATCGSEPEAEASTGRHANLPLTASRDQGTVLVVGLLILVVMMLLGLNSMQTSVLEELMAGQSKQQNTAFHAAEAGMQAALSHLATLRTPPAVSTNGNIWPGCKLTDTSCDSTIPSIRSIIASWKDFDPDAPNAQLQGRAMSALNTATNPVEWSMNPTQVEPHFVIESRYVQPLEFEDAAERKGYHFFTVAAVGFDPGTNSRAVLQSTITKLFP
jgi:type IV pilus assembly protein PilX